MRRIKIQSTFLLYVSETLLTKLENESELTEFVVKNSFRNNARTLLDAKFSRDDVQISSNENTSEIVTALELCVNELSLHEKYARQTDDFDCLNALNKGREVLQALKK